MKDIYVLENNVAEELPSLTKWPNIEEFRNVLVEWKDCHANKIFLNDVLFELYKIVIELQEILQLIFNLLSSYTGFPFFFFVSNI